MNIWKYRQIILNNFKNIYFDSICERKIPDGLYKKYIIRKDSINKYDDKYSYINSYFFNSAIHIIGYHLNTDKWYPIYNYEYNKKKEYVNIQFFFKYKEYLKRVQKRTLLSLFLIRGFDGNIIKNISDFLV
jgi:hypothetical protein